MAVAAASLPARSTASRRPSQVPGAPWTPLGGWSALSLAAQDPAYARLPPAWVVAAAPLTLGTVLTKNLIPVTLGNAFAGAIIVGAGFSFLHGSLGKGK